MSGGEELSSTATLEGFRSFALGLTVPVRLPFAASAIPAGSSPVETVNVYGAVPPVAATLAAYASPTLVSASAAVVIRSGSTMSIVSACVSVAGVSAESVTWTVKLALPAGPVGVPECARECTHREAGGQRTGADAVGLGAAAARGRDCLAVIRGRRRRR